MATLLDLVQRGELQKLEACLSWREQEERRIYAFPTAVRWLTESLPGLASDWNLEITPSEQLDDFFVEFCSGHELMFERQIRPIRHIRHGVWELKTADTRLFGWFAARDCFICTNGGLTSDIKKSNLYDGHRDEAVRLRSALDLDEPKFVAGNNPNDVVSNFCFP
ncbi:hypothetical protein [Allopontixanthobacter sp.]|uniref:hypothetical protein n=1 Tax=Allopontixanthobacter sp. TaxID=2906452 RepID=UPI002ABA7BBB|nr:hypothetical protein [Allopontixanthobacter sp.]MDZ4308755.1 hypothetical protein [Allopontixanthobacter sp.]